MNIDILTVAELERFRQLIGTSDKIVLCCHRNPDGDAVGSMLGLSEYLHECGKVPVVIVPDAYPDFLQWLPGTERMVRYDKHKSFADEILSQADLLFCLPCFLQAGKRPFKVFVHIGVIPCQSQRAGRMQPRLLIPFIQDRAHLFEQLPDPQLSMRLAADEHGRSGLQVRTQQRPAFLAARFPHMADSRAFL